MKSFCDYLGLSNSCSYDVDDVIGRVDRFGFQNFCSPGLMYHVYLNQAGVFFFLISSLFFSPIPKH